jgi:hypothetical protein
LDYVWNFHFDWNHRPYFSKGTWVTQSIPYSWRVPIVIFFAFLRAYHRNWFSNENKE